MIAVVDYKAANLASVQKAIAHLGFDSQITDDPEVVRRAERVILPGVGHFSTMQRLQDSGLRAAISDSIREGIPFLGICVGMQWLFAGSTEAPDVPGLGLFEGMCEHFPTGVKSPHVGWNDFEVRDESTLFRGIPRNAFVYFTHSYRAPVAAGVVATTLYGTPFAAAVERDNVFGVQFHPEKSGAAGIQILKNFCEAAC
ncbi:MAG: imidazole glycerol phosphate synthase subunit HisH [Terriglobia bacterium]|jgi:glutamine amidotransferase|nr:imidazole glycerol phosphate synthase subunit HisH [Terriglobia bacterium]